MLVVFIYNRGGELGAVDGMEERKIDTQDFLKTAKN